VPSIPLPDPPPAAGGVRLRPWREADLPAALRGTHDPLVPRFTRIPENNTMENLRAHLWSHGSERESGEALHLAIADAASDEFLGAISLLRFAWDEARCEVGYWLAPEGRGRGAATAGARLIADWALASLPVERVEIRTHPENAASQRVAERAGFAREGPQDGEIVFALERA
jgi:RimJ/RimL family protein N-acetyltransferase